MDIQGDQRAGGGRATEQRPAAQSLGVSGRRSGLLHEDPEYNSGRGRPQPGPLHPEPLRLTHLPCETRRVSTSSPDASCPRCRDLPLRPLRTPHGTLGFCTGCKGHHVTKEAGDFLVPLLARLVKRLTEAAGEGRCARGVHLLADGQEHCFVCPVPSLRCPACISRMVPLEVHGQTVDVCTLCPGMWLDANELTALRTAQQQRPSTHREPRELPGSLPGESRTFLGTAGEVAGETIGEVVVFVVVEAISGLFS